MKVQANIISECEREWFGIAPQNEAVVKIRVAGWFPTEKFCGVKNRLFDYAGDAAKKTGILKSNGASGSETGFFLKSKAKTAIAALLEMRNDEWERLYKNRGIEFETRIGI